MPINKNVLNVSLNKTFPSFNKASSGGLGVIIASGGGGAGVIIIVIIIIIIIIIIRGGGVDTIIVRAGERMNE